MEQTKEKSYGLAILAAVGMALVGAIVYGALYCLGYVAFLGAYLIFILASWGFKKVRKQTSLDKKDYLFLSLISIAVTVVALFVALTLLIVIKYEVTLGQAIDVLKGLFQDTEFTATVVGDIIWGVGFVIAAVVSTYITEKRKAKQQALTAANQEPTPKEASTTDNEEVKQDGTTETKEVVKEETSAQAPQTEQETSAQQLEPKKQDNNN